MTRMTVRKSLIQYIMTLRLIDPFVRTSHKGKSKSSTNCPGKAGGTVGGRSEGRSFKDSRVCLISLSDDSAGRTGTGERGRGWVVGRMKQEEKVSGEPGISGGRVGSTSLWYGYGSRRWPAQVNKNRKECWEGKKHYGDRM